MNNETVGSRTGNNVGKVIVNVVDKNGQILTPPEEYQGMPGTAFYIDVPDLNGYIVQGLSGDSTTLSYLTDASFKRNVSYPANLGSVVAVSPNGTAAGTFGRGTLTYNLVYAPYVQAQPINPNPVQQQQTQYQAAAAPRKQKHHWFRWIVIILLIIIILSVWGLYNAGKNAQQQVKQNPVVVKNYNTKPSNNNGNSNSSNGNNDSNSNNSDNQQAQHAIDNAKQQIEQHIDQNNSNMLQQITAAIQDGFSMITARIQAFFQGF
ncbi:hypothetical protein BGL34_04070 [Fructilactobacillus lindneri]|uniref:MucBP domain-containing protein n=2 Tax=Fructilactobacillus lindneri TaxID=53444 RepID=A0A0R2JNX4_9LACO|nr:hypothetical protein [Fructilactobacillus lindneri]ANZ57707.1 hypothetical protein AYR60_02470 [Fructilactobacillus lindneri]ANZ58977.1 hypothetical protein AYR59_02470 [Fructilactobacillus lindneri]KRN78859.1 hypothetical protein IV52_GL001140 [Fructilactobacillus lindneri DSM 20690 = JCM 11027]POG98002.1 hypothetical protein BGL31_04685 [Fructilactobacillus lindneri]POG99100.1 hypothetical protein BGL32_06100 [Fructilactobacillus lindneri]